MSSRGRQDRWKADVCEDLHTAEAVSIFLPLFIKNRAAGTINGTLKDKETYRRILIRRKVGSLWDFGTRTRRNRARWHLAARYLTAKAASCVSRAVCCLGATAVRPDNQAVGSPASERSSYDLRFPCTPRRALTCGPSRRNRPLRRRSDPSSGNRA